MTSKIKILFTAPTLENPIFTNVKVIGRDGVKRAVVFNGARDGRGKSNACFFSKEEMLSAVKRLIEA